MEWPIDTSFHFGFQLDPKYQGYIITHSAANKSKTYCRTSNVHYEGFRKVRQKFNAVLYPQYRNPQNSHGKEKKLTQSFQRSLPVNLISRVSRLSKWWHYPESLWGGPFAARNEPKRPKLPNGHKMQEIVGFHVNSWACLCFLFVLGNFDL